MSEYNPPSIEACLDKPADGPMLERHARGMVSSEKMMYWHERAMRAEAALQKAHCELSVEEVDPDDCRASTLKILSDAIQAAPGSTDSGEGKPV